MTRPSTQWEVGRRSSEGAAAASAAARRRGSASRKATLKARAPEEDLLPTDRQKMPAQIRRETTDMREFVTCGSAAVTRVRCEVVWWQNALLLALRRGV